MSSNLSLRAYNCYEDPERDNCFNLHDGTYTHAVLCIGNIRIPMCKECVERLAEDLNEFNNTIFCHKCLHFIPSEAGWNYGGSCKKWAKDDKGIELTSADAGYLYCKNNFDTCKNATPKVDKVQDKFAKAYEHLNSLTPEECVTFVQKVLEDSGIEYSLIKTNETTPVDFKLSEPQITVNEMNIFDQREIHHDCTVEVLSNSITGQVSIGWWPNDNPPATLTNEGEIIE